MEDTKTVPSGHKADPKIFNWPAKELPKECYLTRTIEVKDPTKKKGNMQIKIYFSGLYPNLSPMAKENWTPISAHASKFPSKQMAAGIKKQYKILASIEEIKQEESQNDSDKLQTAS